MPSDTDRIKRLERSFLAFAALLTGEAATEAKSADELEALQMQLGIDMQEMAKEL